MITVASVIHIADRMMDLMCRAQVLESAAGLPAGTWSRNPMRLIPEMQAWYGSGLHPSWTSTKDVGVFAGLVNGAKKMVKGEGHIRDAEEIAQNLVMGLSPDGEQGRKPVFAEIGKEIGAAKLRGGANTQHAVGLAMKFGMRAGDDVLREEKTQKKHREESNPSLVNLTPGEGEEGVHDAPSFASMSEQAQAQVLSELIRSPEGRIVRDWLHKVWSEGGRPADREKALYWLDHMNQSNKEIADSMGVSAQAFGQALDRMTQVAVEAIQKNPKLLNFVQTKVEALLAGGMGHGIRLASSNVRVAAILKGILLAAVRRSRV